MDELFTYDPGIMGSKGLVYIGEKILVNRRDDKTDKHPLEIDLPGGAPEGNETPFEVLQREIFEEFGLQIAPADIVYGRRYKSTQVQGKFAYFLVVKLPAEVEQQIVFGEEGLEYMLVTIQEYLAMKDAWPVMQTRTHDYLATLSGA